MKSCKADDDPESLPVVCWPSLSSSMSVVPGLVVGCCDGCGVLPALYERVVSCDCLETEGSEAPCWCIVGPWNTSLRFSIWLALLSSIDWIATDDSVPWLSEFDAESDESCGFPDSGDLSPLPPRRC